ncbi:ATP-binding cassette domain-containing protein [Alphaproteobacteria bacterium LSUCC0684]
MSSEILPICVENISVTRGGRRLLHDVSCTIEREGISVIMGPNGAGKSLFIRCLHGLTEIDAGTMLFGNLPLNAGIRQQQSMVFQTSTMMRRSVLANMLFAAHQQHQTDHRHIHEILEKVGLDHLSQQSARLLSGGEKQRLALARALVTRPKILFLDEATSNLDPASTKIIEDIISAESQSGTKVVAVTHDISQARRLADDVIFLNAGRLCEHSPASRFFKKPSSDKAQAYLAGKIVI